MEASRPETKRALALLEVCGWIALYAAVAAALQSLVRHPPDADAAAHFAIGALMRQHGILEAFPWTTWSWHSVSFADPSLLLHLAFLPLVGLGYATASKIVAAALGTALLSVLYLALRSERVPLAGVWPLMALASSGYFALRFMTARPYLLSVAVVLAVAWAAARRRWVLLALGSFLYPYASMAFALIPGVAVAAEAGRLLARERPDWRPPALATAGLAAGLLTHPSFPAILSFADYIRDVLAQAWGSQPLFDLGPEFQPFSPRELLDAGVVPFALAAAGVVLALRRARGNPVAVAFALSTVVFAALTALSARFIEYLSVFATATLALALPAQRGAAAGTAWVRRSALGGLAICLLWTGTLGSEAIAYVTRVVDAFAPPMPERLRGFVPRGEQVFTCGWEETGELLVALPERRFMVKLDPNYFWKHDPEAYRRWYSLTHLQAPRPVAAEILRDFGARWVYCRHEDRYVGFLQAIAADPQARLVLRNRYWSFFALDERPRAPPADGQATR